MQAGAFFAIVVFFYLWRSVKVSAALPLWYDELYSLHVANQPSLAAIWHALSIGADMHPPMHYWLAHLALKVVPDVELAMRLPSIIVFLITCFLVFEFIRRRLGALYGCLGFMTLLTSRAQLHSYEARGYALLIMFCALALLSWQSLRQTAYPAVWSALLGISVLGGMYSHFYAFFFVLPLVVGEIAYFVKERRINWWFVTPVFLAGIASFSLYPIAQSSRRFVGNFWTSLSFDAFLRAYTEATGNSAFLMALIAFMCCVVASFPSVRASRKVPTPELVAVASFLLLPVFCYLLGVLVTRAFQMKYVVEMWVGGAILFPFIMARLFRRRVAVGALAILVSFYLVLATRPAPTEEKQGVTALRALASDSAPVLAFGFDYLELRYYGPIDKNRLITSYIKEDNTTEALRLLGQIEKIQVIPLDRLLSLSDRILVLRPEGRFLAAAQTYGWNARLHSVVAGVPTYVLTRT